MEAYGALLAAELERATVEDDPLLAVCMDLSEACDTVHLELLEFLLGGSGLAAEIWRPMLDMARAPRRVKVLQAVGGWKSPTSGMLPGCPGATFVMGLLLERWRRGTKQPASQPKSAAGSTAALRRAKAALAVLRCLWRRSVTWRTLSRAMAGK